MTLDRTCYAIGSMNYPTTANLLSVDDGENVYCDCYVRESDVLAGFLPTSTVLTGIQCVMNMLRCPLEQILNLEIL